MDKEIIRCTHSKEMRKNYFHMEFGNEPDDYITSGSTIKALGCKRFAQTCSISYRILLPLGWYNVYI
jgi:hypothetical protein